MHAAFETLALEKIEKRLRTATIGRSNWGNELWEEIDSTNTRIAQLAAEAAPEGVFVAARQQTAGRGRLGRTWVSPRDAGVYLSILLRPDNPAAAEFGPITLAIGAAVAQAVEKTAGVKLGLKWVNDLVFEGRKVGGILAEMPSTPPSQYPQAKTNSQRAVIIGVGLNVRADDQQSIPAELAGKMTWLEEIAGMPIDPNELVAQLCFEIETYYGMLKNKQIDYVIEQWRARSVTLNQDIIASSGNNTIEGRALDIDRTGALVLKTADGSLHTLHAGEITIRAKDGSYT